jgi:hypothetical protein
MHFSYFSSTRWYWKYKLQSYHNHLDTFCKYCFDADAFSGGDDGNSNNNMSVILIIKHVTEKI